MFKYSLSIWNVGICLQTAKIFFNWQAVLTLSDNKIACWLGFCGQASQFRWRDCVQGARRCLLQILWISMYMNLEHSTGQCVIAADVDHERPILADTLTHGDRGPMDCKYKSCLGQQPCCRLETAQCPASPSCHSPGFEGVSKLRQRKKPIFPPESCAK